MTVYKPITDHALYQLPVLGPLIIRPWFSLTRPGKNQFCLFKFLAFLFNEAFRADHLRDNGFQYFISEC